MRLIFCSDPLDSRKPDPDYLPEVEAAKALAIDHSVIDFEALIRTENGERSVRLVPEHSAETLGIYRGWMLKPQHYAVLYEALIQRGVRLINDPAAYVHCHYLPESYPVIETYTPRTVWFPVTTDINYNTVMELLEPFGSAPIIVKDYVKSQKHYWNEAFYIPSATDRSAVERVVKRFMELQGDDLNVGLVFREFLEFEPIGTHTKSNMPITLEYRYFFLDGEPLYSIECWPDAEYAAGSPPIEQFREVAKAIQSRFFTMDIAKRVDGQWMIVELGDGQVAGLPERADAIAFYTAVKQNVSD